MRFDAGADAARPTLLMLPQGCYVLAPSRLPPASSAAAEGARDDAGGGGSFAYSTEFGALLEPGESFGWQGYQAAAAADDGGDDATADGEGAELAAPGEVDDEAPRLARIQRLYGTDGQYASGTTSLLSLAL